jgi:AcrR family transcriptional regulator
MARLSKAVRDTALAESRQRLLDAAANEFACEGYAGANINRISLAAGFAKGTVYNYFPSKQDLMLALIDATACAHTEAVLQQVESEQEPARRLEGFFRAGFAFVEQQPAQARVIVNAVYGPNSEIRERVYKAYERLFTWIARDIVEAGIARGDFQTPDTDLATALIMTVYLGSCSQLDPKGKIWLDPGQVAHFVLDGLCARSRSSGKVRG